jgi:hypothetical protein
MIFGVLDIVGMTLWVAAIFQQDEKARIGGDETWATRRMESDRTGCPSRCVTVTTAAHCRVFTARTKACTGADQPWPIDRRMKNPAQKKTRRKLRVFCSTSISKGGTTPLPARVSPSISPAA